METEYGLKEMWIPGNLGKLEFRVDKIHIEMGNIHRVVIASISDGGEPVYVSPSMKEEEALELWDVMASLYDCQNDK